METIKRQTGLFGCGSKSVGAGLNFDLEAVFPLCL